MANRKISQLSDGTALQDGDLVVIARSGANYKLTGAELKEAIFGRIVDDETPAGSIDGANQAFTLTLAPSPVTSLRVYVNGLLQRRGTDYVLSGTTITYTAAPQSGDNHRAFYRY